ncbi:hypothetical protein APHNP_0377 [Anaplasma phagocytophilum str. ApNP]|uniref:Uncharacterized protein n=1 Tax=Anaplasma phagocytophilum str. ApNP TaxID=1359153 RepID=A0A0F3NFB7_ANAPH|nr:hypothetical protein APHWEB_1123 [Anaplasma phagocytophilum str. Webster]KJV66725.1 hypothetical protein APHNP_0377 [Anaplasma phagocytophilum str. ApNP]KJV86726.1 hypothetical protein APHNYW_0904 [Anaplasma phagocytophilum str. ApNYW]KJV98288.1 hypothetical protein OTSANNIE_1160 [Anaplasma phagocytophilum str. Annie]
MRDFALQGGILSLSDEFRGNTTGMFCSHIHRGIFASYAHQ